MEIPTQEQLDNEVNLRTIMLVRKLYTIWHIIYSLQKSAKLSELGLLLPDDLPIDPNDISVMYYQDHGVALHYLPRHKDKLNVLSASIAFRRIGADSQDVLKPISAIKGGGSVLTSELTDEVRTNLLGGEYQVEKREMNGFHYQMSGLNSTFPSLDEFDAGKGTSLDETPISPNSLPVIDEYSAGEGAETSEDPIESLRIKRVILDFWEPILEYV